MLIKQTVIVDLFLHSGGPFGGPFFDWGGGGVFRTQGTPPPPPANHHHLKRPDYYQCPDIMESTFYSPQVHDDWLTAVSAGHVTGPQLPPIPQEEIHWLLQPSCESVLPQPWQRVHVICVRKPQQVVTSSRYVYVCTCVCTYVCMYVHTYVQGCLKIFSSVCCGVEL